MWFLASVGRWNGLLASLGFGNIFKEWFYKTLVVTWFERFFFGVVRILEKLDRDCIGFVGVI